MSRDQVKEKLKSAMTHVKFALHLCLQQYKQDRFFIFEHPASASSWSTKMMQQMLNLEGITTAKFDFCQLGMETMGRSGEAMAAKKRTTVMTNSPNVSEVLRQAQLAGKHSHKQLVGGKAKNCEVYPDTVVELVCEGIRKEILDAKSRGQMARQFDMGNAIEKLMKIQTSLDDLADDCSKVKLSKSPQTRKEGMPDERATELPREWQSKAFPVPPHEELHMMGLYDGCEFYDDISGIRLDHGLAVRHEIMK